MTKIRGPLFQCTLVQNAIISFRNNIYGNIVKRHINRLSVMQKKSKSLYFSGIFILQSCYPLLVKSIKFIQNISCKFSCKFSYNFVQQNLLQYRALGKKLIWLHEFAHVVSSWHFMIMVIKWNCSFNAECGFYPVFKPILSLLLQTYGSFNG